MNSIVVADSVDCRGKALDRAWNFLAHNTFLVLVAAVFFFAVYQSIEISTLSRQLAQEHRQIAAIRAEHDLFLTTLCDIDIHKV